MEQLLSQIIAEPADLAARSVYGDALVEAGDPRGELVVSQCTLAIAGVERVEDLVDIDADASELGRLAAIQRRVQQLEARYGRLWAQPLELPADVGVKFRRGMPESITIGPDVVAAPLLERLAKLTPIGELVVERRADIAGLENLDWSGLRTLAVHGVHVSAKLLEAILSRAPLRWLQLSWAGVDAELIDRLARHPALRKLQRLELAGAQKLGTEPIMRLLEAHPDLLIAVRQTRLDDAQVLALLRAAPQLCGLDVRDNPLSVAVLREMVALPRLRYLGFDPGRTVNHDKGTVGRAVAKAAAPLRSIALGGSVNGAGLAAIAAASRLADGLRAINLVNDRPGKIGAEGNAALATMRNLVMLDVRWESTDVGFALMKLPTLAHFDCGHVDKRDVQKRLAAHYGSSVPAYDEDAPTFQRGAAQRRIEVPDKPGITVPEISATLAAIPGLAVERATIEWLLRDPNIVADPIGVTLKKYPNKPRYITLWYWPDDAHAWAARIDELAAALAKASGGKDVDAEKASTSKPSRKH